MRVRIFHKKCEENSSGVPIVCLHALVFRHSSSSFSTLLKSSSIHPISDLLLASLMIIPIGNKRQLNRTSTNSLSASAYITRFFFSSTTSFSLSGLYSAKRFGRTKREARAANRETETKTSI